MSPIHFCTAECFRNGRCVNTGGVTASQPTPDPYALEAMRSVLRKAFGRRMNEEWSAWANETLTNQEQAALNALGIEIQDAHHV